MSLVTETKYVTAICSVGTCVLYYEKRTVNIQHLASPNPTLRMMKGVLFQNSVSVSLNLSIKLYVKSIRKERHVIVPRSYIMTLRGTK
jgi:hypothetical protein